MKPKFSADLENKVRHILEKRNIKVIKCEESGNSGKGDGYLGDIIFIIVKGENSSQNVYNLTLKCGKQVEILRKDGLIQNCFKNELFVYEQILPAFHKFQRNRGIKENIFNAYPKYYGSDFSNEKEVLVFDNLSTQDYALWNRNIPMNIEHIKRILTEYGKLHAISMAIKDQQPDLFKKLFINGNHYISTVLDNKNDVWKSIKANFLEACELFKNEKTLYNKLLNAQVNDFMDSIHKINYPHQALTHGDCWNNNFMFKYNDEKKINPSNVAILDWQLSKLSSPIFDLANFLYCCASKNELNHFNELIQTYYDSFSTFLKQLGSDPHAIYPYDIFTSDWQKLAKYGLFMSSTVLKVCLCNQNECPEYPDDGTTEGEITDYFIFEITNKADFESRFRDLVEHFNEKNFI